MNPSKACKIKMHLISQDKFKTALVYPARFVLIAYFSHACSTQRLRDDGFRVFPLKHLSSPTKCNTQLVEYFKF